MAQPKAVEELHWPAAELLDDRTRTGHFDLAREIIDASSGRERDLILQDLFWYGLAQADWDLAKFSVDAGFDLNPEAGEGPIHDALTYLPGRPDVIEWLLDHGADVERRGRNYYTPLIYVAQIESEAATVAALLRHGADIEASTIVDNDFTALIAAARSGNLAAVRILLEHGADVNRRDVTWDEDAAGHARLGKQLEVAEFIERYLAELPPAAP